MNRITFLLLTLATLTGFADSANYTVHEWGTFTSVQGSDGVALPGLEKEEEALPSFVHSRNSLIERATLLDREGPCQHSHCKGECCEDLQINSQPLHVTQKMETPVLYFYSQTPRKVDVTVDFPQGIISQYFPMPTSFLPAVGPNAGLQNGQIHYSQLEILSETSGTKGIVPEVVAGNVYGPARGTNSNVVRINDEMEKFIFYRGLGDFKTSLMITSNAKELTLTDTIGNGIPYMLALNIQNGKAAFKVLGSLANGQSRSLDLPALQKDLTPISSVADFEAKVKPELVAALERSGLYHLEATSMVNTWRVSYFHTEGLRVLYILPRTETDKLLPLRLSPQPTEVVRTLVGRIEVLTQSEESRLLLSGNLPEGRFREPARLRLQQINAHSLR